MIASTCLIEQKGRETDTPQKNVINMSIAIAPLPPADDLVKKRQCVMEMNLRTQLENAQAELRRNAELLTTLRRENKELQAARGRAERGQLVEDGEEHFRKEEELLHNKLCVLKRSLNAVKGKNSDLQKAIETTMQENAFTLKEGGAYVDEGSAVTQKIRTLENRLDKCLIKHNEVEAIRKTYEVILERLQLEQVGFDLQLNALEKTIANDSKELDDLNTVGAESSKGRDEAKSDLTRLRKKLVEERRTQRKDLEQRRQFVQGKREFLEARQSQLLVKMEKQQERHNRILNGEDRSHAKASKKKANGQANDPVFSPQELERIQYQKEAYQRLRDVTMSQNVGEVVHKLLERRHNHKNLKKVLAELEDTVSARTQEVKALRAQWDEVNQQAGGAMVRPPLTRSARDVQKRRVLLLEEQQQQQKQLLLQKKGNSGAEKGTLPPLQSSPTSSSSPASFGQKDHPAGAGSAFEEQEALLSRLAYSDYRLLAERKRENKKIVEEFELHLRNRQKELEDAHRDQESLSRLLLDVEAGVQQLAQKLFMGATVNGETLTPPAIGGGAHALGRSGGDPMVSGPMLGISLSGRGGVKSSSTNSTPPILPSAEESLPLVGATEGGGSMSEEGLGWSGGIATPASNATVSLLRSCEEKLQAMLEELATDEIEAAQRAIQEEKVNIPVSNIRLPQLLAATRRYSNVGGGGGKAGSSGGQGSSEGIDGEDDSSSADRGGGGAGKASASCILPPANAAGSGGKHFRALPQLVDDFPDNEVHDRQELKMMSLAAVEREIKKAKQMLQRRKEEGH